MQSANTGLHFYANEFVFLLCNENAGAFTRFVGFGPAAGSSSLFLSFFSLYFEGHLAVRGLMNFGDVAQKTGEGEAGSGGELCIPYPSIYQSLLIHSPGSTAASAPKVTNWKERNIPNP